MADDGSERVGSFDGENIGEFVGEEVPFEDGSGGGDTLLRVGEGSEEDVRVLDIIDNKGGADTLSGDSNGEFRRFLGLSVEGRVEVYLCDGRFKWILILEEVGCSGGVGDAGVFFSDGVSPVIPELRWSGVKNKWFIEIFD